MHSKRDTSVTAPNFPRAFRAVRVAKGATQESFDVVSSRTYVSLLERGINAPTVLKVDELVRVLDLHPLTVLALSYVDQPTEMEIGLLLARVAREVGELDLKAFSAETMPRGVKPSAS